MVDRIKNFDNISGAESKEAEINNQLEGVWGDFFQGNQKDQLKALDYTDYNRKNDAEAIFDTRVNNNKDKIKNRINIVGFDQQKELEIADEILTQSLDLNEAVLKTELEILKNGVNMPTQQIPGLDKVLTAINNQPDVTPQAKKTLTEYIKDGEIMLAITEAMDLLSDIFGSFMGNAAGTISETYDNISNNLNNIDFIKMTKDQISDQIDKLNIKIDSISDINKKLSITYVLSIFKEQLIKKTNPAIDKFGLLKENITLGTVLLLNKKTSITDGGINLASVVSKAGSSSLENYDDSLDVSFSHSVIVSSLNPTKITHSTMKKFGEEGDGVQEIPLKEYLNSYPSVNILALEMPQENKDKALNYAKQKLDQKTNYDGGMRGVAVNELSGGYIGKDNLENVNCVELIAEGLGEEKIKDISNPNDFLKSDILKPTYMTTISS